MAKKKSTESTDITFSDDGFELVVYERSDGYYGMQMRGSLGLALNNGGLSVEHLERLAAVTSRASTWMAANAVHDERGWKFK